MNSPSRDPEEAGSYRQVGQSDLTEAVNRVLLSTVDLSSKQNVLDIGCGAGSIVRIVRESADFAGRIVGIDPDEDAIRVARELVGQNAPLIVGAAEDVLELFPPQSFDAVFAANAIHLFDDIPRTVGDCRKLLTEGGLLAFCTAYYAGAEVTKMGPVFAAFLLEVRRAARVRLGKRDTGRSRRPLAVRRELNREYFEEVVGSAGLVLERAFERAFEVPVSFLTDVAVTDVFLNGILPGVPHPVAREIVQEAIERISLKNDQPMVRNWLFVTARREG